MPRRVEFQGRVHEFPDGATDDQVRTALLADGAKQESGDRGQELNAAGQADTGESFLGEIGKAVMGVAGGLRMVKHPITAVADAPDMIAGQLKASADQFHKGREAWSKGQYSEAFGHFLGTVPLLGPAAAAAGETIGGTAPEVDNKGNVVKPGAAPNAGAGVAKGLVEVAGVLAPRVAAEGAGKLLRRGEAALAPRLMKSAIGAPPGTAVETVRGAVGTALENAIPISEAGAARIEQLVGDLNTQVRGEIARQPGVTVDPYKVAARADEVGRKFSKQVNPNADLRTVEGVKREFLENAGAQPGKPAGAGAYANATPAQPARPIPAIDAQDMKVGTYAVNKSKYGKVSEAQVEAEKALAHGLMEELNAAFPAVNNLNASQAKLLDLQPLLDRAVRRASNTGEFGVHAGAASTAAAAMRSVIQAPGVKSRLAIRLHLGSLKTPAPLTRAQAAARIELFTQQLAGGGDGEQPAR